jgi:predicted nucleic acid-binding protein
LSLVLDSSVALAWCFEDERTAATLAVLDRVTDEGAVVPVLWSLEVLNALLMAERHSRLDGHGRHRLAGLLRDLPIAFDPETAPQAWSATIQLAERCRLTVYDAAYLELAERLELPLATLDRDLRAAATSLAVPLLGVE